MITTNLFTKIDQHNRFCLHWEPPRLQDLLNSARSWTDKKIKNNIIYYSFKIFPRFWLVKTMRIIHQKQLLLTKNFVILNRQKMSKGQPAAGYWTIDVKVTSKVQPVADYWTIDVKDYWTIDWENLGTRLCHSTKREMGASRVYKFEWEEYFEWIIKQLLNSAFVGYEEFCRSRRVLSISVFSPGG